MAIEQHMVDWTALAYNGLWVLGAALILANSSCLHYEARRQGERLPVLLSAPRFRLGLSAGLTLIGLAGALLGSRWWERVLFFAICAIGAWQLWAAWREVND
jgi:hypothetical protein